METYFCDSCLLGEVYGDISAKVGNGIDAGKVCVSCIEEALTGIGTHPAIAKKLADDLFERRILCGLQSTNPIR